jgi:hypothetical protein
MTQRITPIEASRRNFGDDDPRSSGVRRESVADIVGRMYQRQSDMERRSRDFERQMDDD